MKNKSGMPLAIMAAALYALNIPFSKLLLSTASSTVMAGLLYLGAGLGSAVIILTKRAFGIKEKRPHLQRSDLPYTISMVLLNILAPVLLMAGLRLTSSSTASLLNNFEVVATSLIALLFFGEQISPAFGARSAE